MRETTRETMVGRLAAVRNYPYTRAGGDKPLDGFEEPELSIAIALGDAFEKEANKGLAQLEATIGSNQVNPAQALDMVADAMQGTAYAFGDAEEQAVLAAVTRAIDNGADVAALARYVAGNPTSVRPLYEGMIDAAKYTTNTYFNRIVYPALEGAIQRLIETPGADSLLTFGEVRDAMASRLKSVPYWRTVANGAASRAYHWGAMNAGSDAGYSRYQLIVTVDDLTSEVCMSLINKVFTIREALPFVQRVATASVQELRQVAPWMTGAQDVEALRSSGHIVPPFHANCRTTVALLR